MMQLRSWWEYHYLLLLVPLGILGTKGIESLWGYFKLAEGEIVSPHRQKVLIAFLVLMFSPVIYATLTDIALLARYKFAVVKAQRFSYQRNYPGSHYAEALAEVGFLSKPDSLPGPIYAAGCPIYYLMSGRDPAISFSYELVDLLPQQWVTFAKELADIRPPYVFIPSSYDEMLREGSPQTVRFLETEYRPLRRSEAGVWYSVKVPRPDLQPQSGPHFPAPTSGLH